MLLAVRYARGRLASLKRKAAASAATIVRQVIFYGAHPVRALSEDQMTYDVKGAPGIFCFVGTYPDIRHPAQWRVERGGRACENRDGVVQIKFGQACHFYINEGPTSSDSSKKSVTALVRFAVSAPATRREKQGVRETRAISRESGALRRLPAAAVRSTKTSAGRRAPSAPAIRGCAAASRP